MTMARLFFWLLISLNGVGLGLWLLLGLAAAKPSHTPLLHVLAFFAVPAAALAAVCVLYGKAPWPWARSVATVLAAAPLVLLLGAAALSGLWAGRSGGWVVSAPPPVATAARPAAQQLEAALRASGTTGAGAQQRKHGLGAGPNQRGDSAPAWFAALATSADPQMLPLLLDRGADLSALDAAGRNAVQVALAQRRWEAAALLIERGAAWQHVQLPNGQAVAQFAATELRRAGLSPQEAESLTRLRRATAGPR
jgi:hypothetical protein